MTRKRQRLRICMTCSAGGHLAQALAIAGALQGDYDISFITYRLPHLGKGADDYRTYFVTNPHVHYFLYPVNFVQALFFALGAGVGFTLALLLMSALRAARIG